MLALADQLDNLRAVPPKLKGVNLEFQEGDGTKDETPKKVKPVETEDIPRKHHRSCKEKSQLRHTQLKKSAALSSHEQDVAPKADRLGDVVAQACLSVARMARVVEKTHNSKTAEALIVRQHLEKASAEAIDSVMDETQGTHTPADIWQVEKKISARTSCKRAKAYGALIEQHNSVSDHLMGKDGSDDGSSEIVDAEEDFHKSISTLISTVITEGAKIPGECSVALTSSILCLVPTLPLDPVLAPSIDLPFEKECKITLGDSSWAFPMSQSIASSLSSSPLSGGVSAPMVAGRSTIKFGQAVIWPITFVQPTMDHPFFKKTVSTNVPTLQKGWGAPSASSSPLLKEPCTSPPDALDLTKSLTDPSVLTEDEGGDDDDDEMPAPGRMDSSNIKDVCRSSKQQESPPTKKAWTEDLGTQKLKSRKASHTLWDEWGKCEGSRKGPEYKQMCYLTFTLVTELEQFIFEKCSFNQPPISHPSPLQASDKPALSSKSTYSEPTCWLQQSQNIDHFWKKDTALVKALRQYHFTSNILEG